MDPLRFLESEDIVEMIVMLTVANRWYQEKQKLDRQLAMFIVNTLAESMKKK
jgi:hypothetical protein